MSARGESGTSIVIGDVPKSQSAIVRVSLNEYRAAKLVDIRIVDSPKEGGGEPIFTKKGVCLRVDRIEHLIHLLQKARDQAQASGWLNSPDQKAA